MRRSHWFNNWKQRARLLKVEAYVLYLAYRDPRVPWYARLYAVCVVGYIFSPVDLIPDFIPILGYLDELVLVPVFFTLARKMIPHEILAEHRETAQASHGFSLRRHWLAAGIIIATWALVTVTAIVFVSRLI